MNRPSSKPPRSSLAIAHAIAAAVGGAAVVLSAVAGGVWQWNEAPAPLIWRDVLLVYLLCFLPLAASLCVAATAWSSQLVPLLLVETVVLVLVPKFYVQARCGNDAARVSGLIEQSRFGEAQDLLGRLLVLDPHPKWQGVELRNAAERVNAIVSEIEARTAPPLAAAASDESRLGRLRDLAMLGHTDEALAMLNASPTLVNLPAAGNLRGTIYETRTAWRDAREWYGRAEAGWQTHYSSPDRAAGLIRALTGLGYCERKLGRLHEAEAAYQKLLTMSPTAESHFLVAQFYEDTQQSKLAQLHAAQAMTLDPARYERSGRQLIDKLVTSHFGCLTAIAQPPQVSSSSAGVASIPHSLGSVP